jgi:hypothetical protein
MKTMKNPIKSWIWIWIFVNTTQAQTSDGIYKTFTQESMVLHCSTFSHSHDHDQEGARNPNENSLKNTLFRQIKPHNICVSLLIWYHNLGL